MKTLLFVVVVIAALMAVVAALDTPIVYVDALTGDCVRAEGPQGQISCDCLPDRYTRVYVGAAQ